MSSNSPFEDSRRVAIVVGIDTYDDSENITALSGAENDAKELFTLLTTTGGFENNDDYLLCGERATQRNILTRISEIFRQDQKYDLAIFYFSGHGFVDSKNELFIATYDCEKKDPYICGLRISDLKHQIYSSENKNNVFLVLDCCYSGVATKDAKGAKDEITSKHIQAIQKTSFDDKFDAEKYGSGKFTIASSNSDKVSWETPACKHIANSTPHVHGTFTYSLLRGLEGEASDQDGVITFSSLQQYVEGEVFKEHKEQESLFSATEAKYMNKIVFAISKDIYVSRIKDLVSNIDDMCTQLASGELPSIRYITSASEELRSLEKISSKNELIPKFKDSLSLSLNKVTQKMEHWIMSLPDDVIISIDKKVGEKEFVDNFRAKLGYLSIDELANIDNEFKGQLIQFYSEVKMNNYYSNKQDKNLAIFIDKLGNQSVKSKNKLENESGES